MGNFKSKLSVELLQFSVKSPQHTSEHELFSDYGNMLCFSLCLSILIKHIQTYTCPQIPQVLHVYLCETKNHFQHFQCGSDTFKFGNVCCTEVFVQMMTGQKSVKDISNISRYMSFIYIFFSLAVSSPLWSGRELTWLTFEWDMLSELSKAERVRQTPYVITYVWNLK